jgi:flagellar protein FliS
MSNNYNPAEALKQYRQLGLETAVNNASPHRLIQLLFEGALARLAAAQGAFEHGDTPARGKYIGQAISIIGGLRNSLDMSVPGDLPGQLDSLYEYMETRLLEASQKQEVSMVVEVMELLKTLKSGWDGIAP